MYGSMTQQILLGFLGSYRTPLHKVNFRSRPMKRLCQALLACYLAMVPTLQSPKFAALSVTRLRSPQQHPLVIVSNWAHQSLSSPVNWKLAEARSQAILPSITPQRMVATFSCTTLENGLFLMLCRQLFVMRVDRNI